MKPRLLDYVVCPKDQSPLKMVAWKFRPIHLSKDQRKLAQEMRIEPEKISKEVDEGVLVNHERRIIYPIIDGVPRLLLFATHPMHAFYARNKARLAQELPGYELPSFETLETERKAANAFRNQIYASELELSSLERAEKNVLKENLGFMLSAGEKPLRRHSVLDVGLGFGAVASEFAHMYGCELIGIDVSHLVDAVHKKVFGNPFFHLIQTSIMAPALKSKSFDFAYSIGALNRLYAPRSGLAKMSDLVKKSGRLNVWFDDDKVKALTWPTKAMTMAETWLSPVIAPLPSRLRAYAILSCMPLYLMHQRLFAEQYADAGLLSGIKGAMAAFERRLESRLNQGLNDEQVRLWFEEHGFSTLQLRKKGWNFVGVEGHRA